MRASSCSTRGSCSGAKAMTRFIQIPMARTGLNPLEDLRTLWTLRRHSASGGSVITSTGVRFALISASKATLELSTAPTNTMRMVTP